MKAISKPTNRVSLAAAILALALGALLLAIQRVSFGLFPFGVIYGLGAIAWATWQAPRFRALTAITALVVAFTLGSLFAAAVRE